MILMTVLALFASIDLVSPNINAIGDVHSQVFQVLEETSNGTEIRGVAEYLHNVVGEGSQKTYQLLDSHETLTQMLKIEPQAGYLIIAGRIDREALCPQTSDLALAYFESEVACVKQVNILATVQLENNQVSVQTIPIRLVIQDVNDNTPSWISAGKHIDGLPILEASILEQGSGNKVYIPAAYDPDSGRNGEISYRLENYRSPSNVDPSNQGHIQAPFTISGPINGMLQLTPFHPIDYEKQRVYELFLIASDAGEPPNVGTAYLRVNVIDVNDEAPVFTQQVFTPPGGRGISERTQPGNVILNVTAIDGDASERNSRLTYSMVPSSNRLITDTFSVHPDGRIILRNWLDYETLEPSHMASSTTALREAQSTKGKQFAFYVKATDSAPPPYEKTGTALVVIPIIDENDERPIITSRFLQSPELIKHGESGVITENSSVPVRLAYIQARDPDFDGQDLVECTVLSNTNISLKHVTPSMHRGSNGDSNMTPSNDFLLTLEEPVDREVTKMLQIRIHCTDQANNTANKLINVRVLDINDEAPSFLWPIFYFSVNENIKVPPDVSGENGTLQGYRIGRLIAFDKDEGDNAKISYSLLPSIQIEEPKLRPSLFPLSDYDQKIAPSQAYDSFRIDSNTGELFALKSFDAEKEKLIKLQVIAANEPTDLSAALHTGTASVYVQILDMNDWSPVFYQVLDNDDRNHQLYAPSILDEPTTVDSYQFLIKENLPANTLVGRISALDPDVSFWAGLRSINNGSVADGSRASRGLTIQFAQGTAAYVQNAFTIHSASGQLKTTGSLDREAYDNYTFSVIAVDRGPIDGVSRTSTATITVLVEDENDNDPVFIRPLAVTADIKEMDESYLKKDVLSSSTRSLNSPASADINRIPVVAISLPTNADSVDITSNPIGRPLFRIEAQDPDSGLNGQIRYDIISGNTEDIFYLDAASGSLVLKAPPQTTKEGWSYLLKFEACDQGTPFRCASPTSLRIVMDRPAASKSGTSEGIVFPATQDTNLYSPLNRFSGGSSASAAGGAVGYPQVWDNKAFGDFGAEWVSSQSNWEDKHRQIRGMHEGPYRRGGVTVSEAVIICVAVIFAVFLCSALILTYLVKRKSIYFSIGGKSKQRVDGKHTNTSMEDYSLQRAMNASAAALTNLESVYITNPSAPGDATEYPDIITRSAFKYPQTVSRDGIQGMRIPPTVFRNCVTPKSSPQTINLRQQSNYDFAAFQRRCTSLKPASGTMAAASTYHYIPSPYAYTPVVSSTPSHIIHRRGISEPNNLEPSLYSPHCVHHRQPYVFKDERHTYHDLNALAATLQRQPLEHFVQIIPPVITSPSYGRLRQPITSRSEGTPNRSITTMKRVRIPIAPIAQMDFAGEGVRTSDEEASEIFDQPSSPNSLSEAFDEAELERNAVGDEEEQELITDLNAKLIVCQGNQTLTPKKMQTVGLNRPPHHQPESESQATEEILVSSEQGFLPSFAKSATQPPPLQIPLTYTVHEASFV